MQKATLEIHKYMDEVEFKALLARVAETVAQELGDGHDVTVNAQMVQKDGGFGYEYSVRAEELTPA